MNKSELEKCIYQCFIRKQGNSLSQLELPALFQIVSEESIKGYANEVNQILEEVIENKYLNCNKRPNGVFFLDKGLHFDQWEAKLNPQTSNSGLIIENLNADKVQLGNHNTMNVGVSVDQFVKALEAFGGKPEAEKKSIIDKVLAAVGTGADVAAAVAAFIAAF